MKKILVCTLTIVFLWMAFCWTKSAKGDEYDRGKNLYENKCQMCHGADGKGHGPAAAAFNPMRGQFPLSVVSLSKDLK
jgi:mono/diheme cytochrome c family protein